jgi:hypothetical protein
MEDPGKRGREPGSPAGRGHQPGKHWAPARLQNSIRPVACVSPETKDPSRATRTEVFDRGPWVAWGRLGDSAENSLRTAVHVSLVKIEHD